METQEMNEKMYGIKFDEKGHQIPIVLESGKTLTEDDGIILVKSGKASVWLTPDDVSSIVSFWANNVELLRKFK